MYGPRIEGGKVVLRPPQESDAEEFVKFLADPEVTLYLARREPPSLVMEYQWLESRATDPNTCSWTIEADDSCVGSVGFDHIDWRSGWANVGIFIGDKSLWRNGITTEVAQLIARHAFMEFGLRRIESGYLEPNIGSGKAQAGIGLREVGRWHKKDFRAGKWHDHVLTELMAEDWFAANPIVQDGTTK